ncbi:MAG: GNAT family N-acetyltransferase [Candidatus Omnitrophota bacterium]
MFQWLQKRQSSRGSRLVTALIIFMIGFGLTVPAQYTYAQERPGPQPWLSALHLTTPGQMVKTSNLYNPTLIKGLRIYPNNPLRFDFILETGDEKTVDSFLYEESNRLIKYFLASLTIPEKDLWVNLSPFEKQRIIPDKFGVTEMGRDLLAQDYVLKQLTASMMYPEDKLGEHFWNDVRQKIVRKYGSAELQLDTFIKVWIVPDNAVVYENGDTAFVVESKLKVMLEQDYIAHTEFDQNKNLKQSEAATDEQTREQRTVTAEIIREILIPAIEKEVNEGKHFATLRQVYHSMILATWFKRNLKESLLGRIYLDQSKTGGVDVADKEIKQKIYDQYLEAFKVGVYNYIKEEFDPVSQELIPRKYFSGGMELQFGSLDNNNLRVVRELTRPVQPKGVTFMVESGVDPVTGGLRSGIVNQDSSRVDPDTLGVSERFVEEEFREFQRRNYSFLTGALQTLISDLTGDTPGETRPIEAPIARFLEQVRQRLADVSRDNRQRNEFLRQYQSLLRVYIDSAPTVLSDLNGRAVSPAARQATEEDGVTGTRTTVEITNDTALSQQIVVQQYDAANALPFFEAGVRLATSDNAVLASTGEQVEINVDDFFGDRSQQLLDELKQVIVDRRPVVIRVKGKDYRLEEIIAADLLKPVFRGVEIRADGTESEPLAIKFFSQFLLDNIISMDKISLLEFFLAVRNDERVKQFVAMPNANLEDNISLQPNMIEMQFIRGTHFDAVTDRGERLRILAEVAREIAYISTTYGAFHGDLHTENIIIDETTGRPRLIDWDTLKMDLDKTDVRSLQAGIKYRDMIVIGEILLNTFSRARATINDAMLNKETMTLAPVNPAEFRGTTTFDGTPQNDMPASIWAIVEKALFANPNENYESMEDLSNDLNQAIAGLDQTALGQSDNAVLADVQTINNQQIRIAPLTKEMLLSNQKYRVLNGQIMRFRLNPIENRSNMDDYSFVLLDTNNEPVGYAIVQYNGNGNAVYMSDFVVAPEFQGTQAASWLLHRTFTNIAEKTQGNVTSAWWSYNFWNRPAVTRQQNFYKAIGASVWNVQEDPDDDVRMRSSYRFNFETDLPTLYTKYQNDLRGTELPAGTTVSPVTDIETPAVVAATDIPPQIVAEDVTPTATSERVGGIDLNPADLIIEKRGKGINMTVPLDPLILRELESMPLDGFAPVIFQIIPVNNLPLLLGIADPAQDEDNPEISIRSQSPYIKEDDTGILTLSAYTP